MILDYEGIQNLKKKLHKQLEALEIVEEMFKEQGIKDCKIVDSLPEMLGFGELDASVYNLAKSLDKEFTISDIELRLRKIKPEVPRTSIRGSMYRLENSGKFSVVSSGKGRRPTVYKCFSKIPETEKD